MHPADLLTRRNLLIVTLALLLAPKGHAAAPVHAIVVAPGVYAESAVSPDAALPRLMAGAQR